MTAPYKISCHCGHIQLEVAAELSDVFDCNCSICSRTGFLHWYVPPEVVRLVTDKRRLSTYVWRSVTGGQHFCPICGEIFTEWPRGYPRSPRRDYWRHDV